MTHALRRHRNFTYPRWPQPRVWALGVVRCEAPG
jgi:hypothetical protein